MREIGQILLWQECAGKALWKDDIKVSFDTEKSEPLEMPGRVSPS